LTGVGRQSRQEANEGGNGIDFEFPHHPSAVHFDSFFDGSKFVRNLFVEQTTRDELADLAFTPRQSCQPFAGIPLEAAPLVERVGALTSARNRLNQLLFVERLHEKIDGPFAHRARGRRYVALPAEEHDWPGDTACEQGLLEVQAINAWHAKVQQKTRGPIIWLAVQKRDRVGKNLDIVAVLPQHPVEAPHNQGIVIDDEDTEFVARFLVHREIAVAANMRKHGR
jgi:hypothetical protein